MERVTTIPFDHISSCCAHCATQRIAKKVDMLIIRDVPNPILTGIIQDHGCDVRVITEEQKIILFGGVSSLIVPCTLIGKKYALKLQRKKCGTVDVHRLPVHTIIDQAN